MITQHDLPPLLQAFFTDRLMRQRQASPDTVASYRDAFCLLLAFATQRLGESPSNLAMADLDAPLIVDFLCWLEEERGNTVRTRNARLAAIHAFYNYVALREPAYSALAQRVLAIPGKPCDRVLVAYLSQPEAEALLAAPDRDTWGGRRDRALMLLAVQTGLRVSELIGLQCRDMVLTNGAHVHCTGKGRKERCTPLRKDCVSVLRSWLRERGDDPSAPVFPSAKGERLSRDGVEYLVHKHANAAAERCPTLRDKRVSPHVLRHTAAMDLLEHGVDRSVIALWLGHETLDTVNVYVHASMQMKERALAKTTPLDVPMGRYRPDDALLVFLKAL
jgi:integrase/recombinase XerD